jgi:hypothetical protein
MQGTGWREPRLLGISDLDLVAASLDDDNADAILRKNVFDWALQVNCTLRARSRISRSVLRERRSMEHSKPGFFTFTKEGRKREQLQSCKG